MRSAGRTTVAVVMSALVLPGIVTSGASGSFGASGAARQQTEPQQPAAAATSTSSAVIPFPHDGDRMTPAAQTSMVGTICIQCHTDRRKPGGVSFEHLTIEEIVRDADLAERMLAKLRAGMMPPQNAPKRPDESSVNAF